PGPLDLEVRSIGVDIDRLPARDAALEFLGCGDLQTRADTEPRSHHAIAELDIDALARVAEPRAGVPRPRAGVVEHVVGRERGPVAREVALDAQREALGATRRVIEAQRTTATERIGIAECADLTPQARLARQRARLEQHHAADRLGPKPGRARALDHGDAIGRLGIDFGRVIDAPLLALVANAVEHDQIATAKLTANDRFAHAAGRAAQDRHAGHTRQHVGQPGAA